MPIGKLYVFVNDEGTVQLVWSVPAPTQTAELLLRWWQQRPGNTEADVAAPAPGLTPDAIGEAEELGTAGPRTAPDAVATGPVSARTSLSITVPGRMSDPRVSIRASPPTGQCRCFLKKAIVRSQASFAAASS